MDAPDTVEPVEKREQIQKEDSPEFNLIYEMLPFHVNVHIYFYVPGCQSILVR